MEFKENAEEVAKTKEVNYLALVQFIVSQDGKLTITGNDCDKKPLNAFFLREVLQKAMNQIDDEISITNANLIVKKLIEQKKIIRAGFRPGFLNKLLK